MSEAVHGPQSGDPGLGWKTGTPTQGISAVDNVRPRVGHSTLAPFSVCHVGTRVH